MPLASSGQQWQFHMFTDNLGVKNGNFLVRMLLATCSGQEWQFLIATDTLLVVNNGNFLLLLTCATDIVVSGQLLMAISHFY